MHALRRWIGGPTWFALGLAAVVALGLLLRVGYIAAVDVQPDSSLGDAGDYRTLADNLAAGRGYEANLVTTGEIGESAEHPPAWPIVLAVTDLVGQDGIAVQRGLAAVLSAGGLLLVGVLGRRVARPHVGLVAALLAAVHPVWLQPGGVLYSEVLYLVLVPALLLTALTLLEQQRPAKAFTLGALAGLATLTRPEALLLVVLLVVPVALLAGRRELRSFQMLGLAVLGTLVLVGPWVARNTVAVGGPTLATSVGTTLAGANCSRSFDGDAAGRWVARCASDAVDRAKRGSPSEYELSRRLQDRALQVARERASSLPRLVLERIGRTWGVWDTGDQLRVDTGDGLRGAGIQRAAQFAHWAVLALSAVGVVALPRPWWRRAWPLATLALHVTLVSALFHGSTRFRVAAEPLLVVLAAAGIVGALSWVTGQPPPWVEARPSTGPRGFLLGPPELLPGPAVPRSGFAAGPAPAPAGSSPALAAPLDAPLVAPAPLPPEPPLVDPWAPPSRPPDPPGPETRADEPR